MRVKVYAQVHITCPTGVGGWLWWAWEVGGGVAFVEVKDQQGLIINRRLMNNDRLWIICYGCSGAMNDEGRQVSNY